MKIIGWHISIEREDGTIEAVADVPNYVAEAVDEYLTELED